MIGMNCLKLGTNVRRQVYVQVYINIINCYCENPVRAVNYWSGSCRTCRTCSSTPARGVRLTSCDVLVWMSNSDATMSDFAGLGHVQ